VARHCRLPAASVSAGQNPESEPNASRPAAHKLAWPKLMDGQPSRMAPATRDPGWTQEFYEGATRSGSGTYSHAHRRTALVEKLLRRSRLRQSLKGWQEAKAVAEAEQARIKVKLGRKSTLLQFLVGSAQPKPDAARKQERRITTRV
jgi:hypothetical protein